MTENVQVFLRLVYFYKSYSIMVFHYIDIIRSLLWSTVSNILPVLYTTPSVKLLRKRSFSYS